MELDLREAAGSAVEPEPGANAGIAAEESPSSVEMEVAETGPDAGPDTGHERKGGGSATLSRDDQRDVSVLRRMIGNCSQRQRQTSIGQGTGSGIPEGLRNRAQVARQAIAGRIACGLERNGDCCSGQCPVSARNMTVEHR